MELDKPGGRHHIVIESQFTNGGPGRLPVQEYIMLQSIIVGLIIAGALAYVASRWWKTARSRRTPSCGACSACHATTNGLSPIDPHCRPEGQ